MGEGSIGPPTHRKQWGKDSSEGPHVVSPPLPRSPGVGTSVVVRGPSSAWICIPALPLTIEVSMGKFLNFSVP